MELPDWLVLQLYVVKPGCALRVICPLQAYGAAVITGTGLGFTDKVNEAVPVQPLASVTVTVYVPAFVTSMDWVVSFVFHRYSGKVGETVSVPDCPLQTGGGPVMAGVGAGVWDTVKESVSVHPNALVTVTV